MQVRKINKRINKKANLLGEQTLKIIISAIALLLLIYLLFALYSTFSEKKNLEKAEATLRSLDERLSDARKTNQSEFPLLEPEGWRLIYFEKGEEQPNSCLKNCLCLCKDESFFDSQIEKCSNEGACKDYDYTFNNVNIELRSDVSIKYVGGGYVINKK